MSSTTIIAVACAAISLACRAERPAVEWAQYPVGPGDNVLLQGGNWGEDATVEIAGRKVRPAHKTDTGLVFAYPSSRREIVRGRVVSGNGKSNEFVLNAPEVWWLQGDGGDIATPGGWLRAFGRSLGGGAMRIRRGGGAWFEPELWRIDDYEIAAKIPADIACGEYEVEVRNSLGGWKDACRAGKWKVSRPRRIWKDDVFDISKFGAVPDDGVDDSDAFAGALAAAGRNGGGTVVVPRGLFNVEGSFEIPTNTLVKGAGIGLSHLKWPDLLDPPPYMLIFDHSIGIHDLFISVGQYRNGITYKANISKSFWAALEPRTHDVSLKNLRLRFVTDQQRDRDKKVFLERFTMKGIPIDLPDSLRVEMVNVDLYCDKCPTDSKYFRLTGWYHRVANCSFRGGAWAPCPGVSFIFEDNEISSGCLSINPMCHGAYFARNRYRDVYRGDPVCLGHDSSRSPYARGCAQIHGKVASGDGRTICLEYERAADSPANREKKSDRDAPSAWIGTSLTIFRGRGAGQTRRITSISDDWTKVCVDRPFGVSPDATSWMYVSYTRRHVLMLDNEFTDAGFGVELYGGANEYIIARNRACRAGGFKAFGFEYSSVIPCWRVQFLDNVITEGSGEKWDSTITARVEDFPFHTRGCVARGNRIDSNGDIWFFCEDGLVEGNFVRNSRYGIKATSSNERFGYRTVAPNYIGSNRFENVEFPYRMARDSVWSPLAKAQHEDWKRELVRKIRAAEGSPMDPPEFVRTFGADSRFAPDPAAVYAALNGARGTIDVNYEFAYDPLSPEIARCTVSAKGSGGWDYGGEIELKKDGDGMFRGVFRITPSGERTGFFTVPVRVRLTGRGGWTAESTIETLILPPDKANYIRDWRYAKVPGAEIPKNASKALKWTKVEKFQADGGVDCTWMDLADDQKFFGNYEDSLMFETKIEVLRPVYVGFCRNDIPGQVFLDGKMIMRAGSWYNHFEYVMLQPGVHVLQEFRPRGGWMMRYRAKSLKFQMTHPRGARPGDYRFVSEE